MGIRIIDRLTVVAAVVSCAAIGALAIAGCGGGSDTTSSGASGASGASGGTPLSQEEFVSQANAVCAEANDKTEALKALPSSPTTADVATFTAQSIEIANSSYAALAAITPPSDLQAKYDQWLAAGKAQIAIATKLEQAAKADDTNQVKSIAQQMSSAGDKNNAVATDLGLTECAKDVHAQG